MSLLTSLRHLTAILPLIAAGTLLIAMPKSLNAEPGDKMNGESKRVLATLETEYQPPIPSSAVEVIRCVWRDAARTREVPAKIFYPTAAQGQSPVIIFSHGLGANRDSYDYLGRHWAGCGYISVHIQHHGSDNLVWKNAGFLNALTALEESVRDPTNAINRARDVRFAIDEVLKLNRQPDSPLCGRIDPQAIGVAGHSFGGWTALAIAGQRQWIGVKEIDLADTRVKAAIAMSAPVPLSSGERNQAFTRLHAPVFLMTGTLDDSPMGETSARERRLIFDKATNPTTCLVTFNGATHFSFGGRAKSDQYKTLICDGSVAFWDAYLRSDPLAKHWLYDGGYSKRMGSIGVFERKPPPAQTVVGTRKMIE